MFASDEAGRTVALGVAVSVLCHTLAAWVIAEYVSIGAVRPMNLEVVDSPARDRDVVGRFADPTAGAIGRTIARQNGTRDAPGSTVGRAGGEDREAGSDPARAASESDPTDGPPADRETAEPADDDPDGTPSPGRPAESVATASGASAPVTDPSEEPSPAPPEGPPAEGPAEESPDESVDEPPTAKSADDREEPDGEKPDPERGRRPGTVPTFPTINGDGGEGSDGQGEGAGSRGGVSIALIEQVIRAHRDEVLECFATRHDYIAAGQKSVVTEFWLGTDGFPTRVDTLHRTTNYAVAECINERMEDWRFPELDEPVSFVKTFTFDARIKAEWVHPGAAPPSDE